MTDRLKRDLDRPAAGGKILRFPTPENLVEALVADGALPRTDVLDDPSGLMPDEAAGIARLVRTWISAGQTGCLYATALAKPPGDRPDVWSAQVVAERLDDELFGLVIGSAMRRIGSADVLMLVFPYVRDDAALADLINQLVSLADWWWEDRSRPQDRIVKVGLRWLLPDREHVSWVLGFAPMPWVPFTRRAPATALVMRVQPDAYTVPAEEPEDGLRGVHLAHMDHGMGPFSKTRRVRFVPPRNRSHLRFQGCSTRPRAERRAWAESEKTAGQCRVQERADGPVIRTAVVTPARRCRARRQPPAQTSGER